MLYDFPLISLQRFDRRVNIANAPCEKRRICVLFRGKSFRFRFDDGRGAPRADVNAGAQ